MAHEHDEPAQPTPHQCGNLFGCGDENGTGAFREDIRNAGFDNRESSSSAIASPIWRATRRSRREFSD